MRLPQRSAVVSILKKSTVAVTVFGVVILWQLPGQPVRAQLLDQLKGAAGLDQKGGSPLGGLGGSLPSVDQASPSNTAGVLQYCVRNNYVNGSAASSVKNSMISKVTGAGQGTHDSEFSAGNNGMLQTGNGQSFGLGGGGIKAQVTQKVCDLVLNHAKSLL